MNYKQAKQTLFDLVPSSEVMQADIHAFRGWTPDPNAKVRQCRDFPLNQMAVGQSFMMHRSDNWPGRFVDVRQRCREQNATKARYYLCIWINNRQTLEVARVA